MVSFLFVPQEQMGAPRPRILQMGFHWDKSLYTGLFVPGQSLTK